MPTKQILVQEEDALTALGNGIPILAKAHTDHLEAEALEEMLNKAMGTMLPLEIKRYGSIYLCRFNNPDRLCADIDFIPTLRAQAELGVLRRVVGIVNFEKKGYAMDPSAGPNLRGLEGLYPVTEKIMQQLGLKKLEEYKRSER